MMVLWVLISVMLLLTCAIVVYPLLTTKLDNQQAAPIDNENLYRDQLAVLKQEYLQGELSDEEYQQFHQELTTSFALEPDATIIYQQRRPHIILAGLLVIILAVASISLYWQFGAYKHLFQYYQLSHAAKRLTNDPTAFSTPEDVIKRLVQQMQANPDSYQGWMLLGKLYMSLNQFNKAAPAYAKAYALQPEDLATIENYLMALFYQNQGKLTVKAHQLAKQALIKDPNNKEILNLLALDAFATQQYQKAIEYWQQLLPFYQDKPKVTAMYQDAIQQAQTRLTFAKQPAKITLTVHVSVSPKLNIDAKFKYMMVYAKAVHGAPMPLAVVKLPFRKLPLTVTLTDKMAVIPSQTLLDYHQVQIIARLSQHGMAMTEVGDYVGYSAVLDPSQPPTQIEVVIKDRARS